MATTMPQPLIPLTYNNNKNNNNNVYFSTITKSYNDYHFHY